jgi:MFS family permease
LPGLLCALVIGALSGIGDIRAALVAQVLAFLGLTALGLLTPPFGVMLIFLFINSMGMHLFMPLQDAIGMSLAEQNQIGRRMGQYSSVRSAFGLIAALLVFFGVKLGFFTFDARVKWVFLMGSCAFVCAVLMNIVMFRRINPGKVVRRKIKLVLRKQYRYYYLLTILHGVQKQIAYVYGTWVMLIFGQKKRIRIAMLSIIVSFISVSF